MLPNPQEYLMESFFVQWIISYMVYLIKVDMSFS